MNKKLVDSSQEIRAASQSLYAINPKNSIIFSDMRPILFNKNNVGIKEQAKAARGCNPPGMVIKSNPFDLISSDNLPPVDIPQIMASFFNASSQALSDSSVLPEQEEQITKVFLLTQLGNV